MVGGREDGGGAEAGTGFFETRFVRREIRPGMATITLTKPEKGLAWGGVHWQYLDDIARITKYHIDPDLAEILVGRSNETVHWIKSKGLRFQANFGRQAFQHEGKFIDYPIVNAARKLLERAAVIASRIG